MVDLDESKSGVNLRESIICSFHRLRPSYLSSFRISRNFSTSPKSYYTLESLIKLVIISYLWHLPNVYDLL